MDRFNFALGFTVTPMHLALLLAQELRVRLALFFSLRDCTAFDRIFLEELHVVIHCVVYSLLDFGAYFFLPAGYQSHVAVYLVELCFSVEFATDALHLTLIWHAFSLNDLDTAFNDRPRGLNILLCCLCLILTKLVHDLADITLCRSEGGLAFLCFMNQIYFGADHARKLVQPGLIKMFDARNLARLQCAQMIWRMSLPEKLLILFQSPHILEL